MNLNPPSNLKIYNMTHSLKPTLAIIGSTHKNNLGNDTPIFIVQKKNFQFFLSVILVRDTGNIYTNLYLTFFLLLRYVKWKKPIANSICSWPYRWHFILPTDMPGDEKNLDWSKLNNLDSRAFWRKNLSVEIKNQG